MTRKRVTVTDIARLCGVSRATVSLVLRGSPLPAAKTRERVQAELKRQGYVYNRNAANLRRRESSTVALVINDLSNPFFAEFAVGVDETLSAGNYVTLLGGTGESVERQLRVLASLMEHDPAGIILSPAEGSDGERLESLLGAQAPMLVFNRELPGSHWDFLAMDNRHGARMATEHFLELGHRHIAFFGGHADSSSCRERRAGYVEAMTAAGLGDATWLVECVPSRLAAANSASHLFDDGHQPTAAVCYNDAVALGLTLGLRTQGIRPGHDFAIAGFDDIPEAAVSAPPLTTLASDPRALGRRAAGRILERVQHPDTAVTQTVVPVRLVVRASSCPPPKTAGAHS
ncbi:MAG TPA: LacI family DNA-binding transcriptional regulator [Rhodanobacteraceae bacterium]